MKRTIVLLLLLVLLPAAALADTLYYAREDAALAADVLACLALPAGQEETRNSVLDALAKDTEGIALITEQQLIEGLQGYSVLDRDTLEHGLRIAAVLGRGDLYVVCGSQTAESCGLTGLSSLKTYLEQNEYGLMMMRSMSASRADYAAWLLLDECSFDMDFFVDEADEAECLGDDMPYVMVCGTARALQLAEAGFCVLGALGAERTAAFPDLPCAEESGFPVIEGTWYALCVSAQSAFAPAAVSLAQQTTDALYLHLPAETLSAEDEARTYVDYMTQEGLFFY